MRAARELLGHVLNVVDEGRLNVPMVTSLQDTGPSKTWNVGYRMEDLEAWCVAKTGLRLPDVDLDPEVRQTVDFMTIECVAGASGIPFKKLEQMSDRPDGCPALHLDGRIIGWLAQDVVDIPESPKSDIPRANDDNRHS